MNVEGKGMGKQAPYIIHTKLMCVSSCGVLQYPLSPRGQRGLSFEEVVNMVMMMCKDFQNYSGNTDDLTYPDSRANSRRCG